MKKEKSEEVNLCQNYAIEPVAVLNDTVGTMMSCAYQDQDQSCVIGMIIGTGTNACYMEEMSNVEHIQGDEGEMCINTEWASFGDNGCLQDIQTKFDKDLDGSSNSKGCFIFEKMISGMYLGELTRLLLVDMAEKKLLFGGEVSKALSERDRFQTSYISDIERENTGLQRAQQILTGLGLSSKPEDCEIVRRVCETISSRSAHLCGAALATIVKRIHNNRGLSQITVGVDGSVYRNHPYYRDRLGEMVKMLAPPNCIVRYATTEDASGKGAAVVAAMAKRLGKKKSIELPVSFKA
ncbi:hexokinase-2-like [Engraulis encrasicolus]|uniref:hexokinase-2-like n=1 Tax=Engraulis encrasicolus TaxID=184585 RepID=UPI002FD0D1D6